MRVCCRINPWLHSLQDKRMFVTRSRNHWPHILLSGPWMCRSRMGQCGLTRRWFVCSLHPTAQRYVDTQWVWVCCLYVSCDVWNKIRIKEWILWQCLVLLRTLYIYVYSVLPGPELLQLRCHQITMSTSFLFCETFSIFVFIPDSNSHLVFILILFNKVQFINCSRGSLVLFQCMLKNWISVPPGPEGLKKTITNIMRQHWDQIITRIKCTVTVQHRKVQVKS